MLTASVNLHPETPEWATGSHENQYFWYYVTDIGEKLVATLDGDVLRFYGDDIGEFALDFEQVTNAIKWIHPLIIHELSPTHEYTVSSMTARMETVVTSDGKPSNPLAKNLYSIGELLWIASVLDAAKIPMQYRQSV